jgi:hypothetical protein
MYDQCTRFGVFTALLNNKARPPGDVEAVNVGVTRGSRGSRGSRVLIVDGSELHRPI